MVFHLCFRSILLLVLLILTCPVPVTWSAPLPGATPATASSQDAPVLEILDTVYDFGEINEDKEVAHEFVVRNRGKAELKINEVRPG